MRDTPAPLPALPSHPDGAQPPVAASAPALAARQDSPAALTLATSLTAAPNAAGAPLTSAISPAPLRPDPTRYGDWELNGKCVDF